MTLKIGLLGAGRIAQTWAEALLDSKSCELKAVADVNPAAARTLATGSARAFGSHTELLATGDVDAVIIATPPSTHDPIAIDACRSGKHVLCEKPFAIDSERAVAMVRAARRSDVKITMASKFRFVDAIREARKLLRRGDIGRLTLFENTFSAAVDMRDRWNSDRTTSGGGVLMDNGTHSLDLFRFFAGAPTAIQTVEGSRPQGLDVEETVTVFLVTEDGVRGDIDLSWSIDKSGLDLVTLHGTKGKIRVGWQESSLVAEDGRVTTFGPGYDKLMAFGGQLDDFASAVQEGSEPLIDFDDALGSVSAVEAAYAALEKGNDWSPVTLLHDRPRAVGSNA